jgi:C_GCAxxG_C_C family probable redox protein
VSPVIIKKKRLIMDVDECVEKGLKHYNNPDGNKFNCSESVLLALCEYLGIESDNIPSIATAFGGGIGGCGKTCGCLTGSVMAIGIKYGRSKSNEDKDSANERVQKLIDNFEAKYKSTDCRDLIGLTMRNIELTDEEKNKLHENVCDKILIDTVRWTAELLKEVPVLLPAAD